MKTISSNFQAVLIPALLLISIGCTRSNRDFDFKIADLPFAMPEIALPNIPNHTVNLLDYGALGDGQTTNTAAFANAIKSLSSAGGGRLVVPAGLWLTGPIRLSNKIELHLKEGSVIQFSSRFEDYPPIWSSWEGRKMVRCTPPLYGINISDVIISGKGIIDGAGDAWRPVKKYKLTDIQWKQLITKGGQVSKDGKIWWPSREALDGANLVKKLDREKSPLSEYAAAREYLRPVLFKLVQCRRILITGVTFQNSPAWNIHPLMCEDLIIRNIFVRNPWYSQNGDGLDLESCRNSLVIDCSFDVGDDAICLKSGRDEYGRERGIPCENISIRGCLVYHGHGGLTIGSEMSGGVRNIDVRNCTFLGTDIGIRFKSKRGRGGIVENIYFSDIYMKDIKDEAISFNMFYDNKASLDNKHGKDLSILLREEKHIDETTPMFRSIYLRDITCRGSGRAMLLAGLPEMPAQDLRLEGIDIDSKQGILGIDLKGITFIDSTINSVTGTPLSFYNSRHVTLSNLSLPSKHTAIIRIYGKKSSSFYIHPDVVKNNYNKIDTGLEVSSQILLHRGKAK